MMSKEVENTEKQILDKSKELFFKEGKIGATNQEIADYCGVQRTLVNYYFRSKDNLAKIVFNDIINELHQGLNHVYVGDFNSFEDRIDNLIDFTYYFRRKYPFFEVFNVIRANNMMKSDMFFPPQLTNELEDFLIEIQKEMDRGTIQGSDPINFLMNILSLVSFPLVMKGIFRDLFGLSEDEFEDIIKERKQVIKNLIFNK